MYPATRPPYKRGGDVGSWKARLLMVAKRRRQSEPQPYLRIFVPGKPVSVNRMYAHGRGGNTYGRRRTEEALAWQQTVWAYTWSAMQKLKLRGGATMRKPLRIDLEFYRLRSNADVDNFVKGTLDGLKEALGVDDRFYDSVSAHRGLYAPTQAQGAVITVWEAAEAA
jgi:Holliday junction resolvase RusA-like endonuclease